MNNESTATILISIVFSILAILFERFLVRLRVVRGNFIGLVLVLVFAIILMNTIEFQFSVFLYGAFIVLVVPLGVNRSDVIDTIMKGRWWWKDKEESLE